MAFVYDPSTPDTRSPEEKLLDINKRLADLPRLRKQEEEEGEDRAEKMATQDEIDKQLARISKTKDILLAAKAELEMQL